MRIVAVLIALLGGCASVVPIDESNLPRQVELADVPFFPQAEYQCGPAALATTLVHRGIETDDQALVDRVYLPARQGSLQVEMVATARAHGLLVYPLGRRLDDLLAEVAAGNPVLVLQNLAFDRWPQWHFAVVVGYDLDNQTLILRSGTERRRQESFRQFLRSWHKGDRWAVVTLPPEQLPAAPQLVVWMQAANDLEESGNPEAAKRAYRTAATRWDSPLPWFALGNLHYAQNDLAQAEQALRTSVARDGQFAPAWNNLAHVLGERQCHAQAQTARRCADPAGAESAAQCRALPACAAN